MAASKDALLILTLDGVDYACQVINADFTYPTRSEATLVPVACGDTVSELGEAQNGSISGEVYKDLDAAGITRALIQALEADAELDYVWREEDLLEISGSCRVSSHVETFTPDRYGRHALALTVSTASTTFDPTPAP